jgi:hypothetical protein
MAKIFTVELPDGAEVSALDIKAGEATYHASRIGPFPESSYSKEAWWTVNRHDEDGCYGFPIDSKTMLTAQDALDSIVRDIAHGKGIDALVTWVCELAEAGRDASDGRAARRYASNVAEACQ